MDARTEAEVTPFMRLSPYTDPRKAGETASSYGQTASAAQPVAAQPTFPSQAPHLSSPTSAMNLGLGSQTESTRASTSPHTTLDGTPVAGHSN